MSQSIPVGCAYCVRVAITSSGVIIQSKAKFDFTQFEVGKIAAFAGAAPGARHGDADHDQ
jgi:hypothetical protein